MISGVLTINGWGHKIGIESSEIHRNTSAPVEPVRKKREIYMYQEQYNDFMSSNKTLRIYQGEQPVYTSEKERLLPLMDYLGNIASRYDGITVFDKVMGNAAALLSVKAGCREVWSPLGSEIAVKTLDKYNIPYHLTEIVPFITRPDGVRMCPMEELSIGKEPEEFYQVMKERIEAAKQSGQA